ncbi:MAG TPA: alpha/beta hydrolase [Cellvibrionaceae bacterium]
MSRFDHEAGQFFEIDGAQIYCEITGNPTAAPLLLLHGGMGTIEDLNIFVQQLAGDFKIIGIDSRGQGKSTLGDCVLTYERIQQDIVAVLERLNISKLSILGFSDGGIIAYRIAALQSVQVDKLITIGADWSGKNNTKVKEIYKKITAKTWQEKFPQTYETYSKLNPLPNFEKLVNCIVKMWQDETPSGYPEESVKNINCPLLIIRGDDDHLVPLESMVQLRQDAAQAQLLNIPRAGHVAFEDQPDLVLPAIKTFLNTP